jgi:hypothetical protein
MCFACDRWDSVGDNVYAITKTIKALRGIERWVVNRWSSRLSLASSRSVFSASGRKPATRKSGCYDSQHDAEILKTSALSACDVNRLSLRNAAIGCEKVNESRPVAKGHDGYDVAPGSRAPKTPFSPH